MNQEHVRYAIDGVAVATTVAALNEWAPPIAAVLSIIWLSIQIGDWLVKKFKRRQK